MDSICLFSESPNIDTAPRAHAPARSVWRHFVSHIRQCWARGPAVKLTKPRPTVRLFLPGCLAQLTHSILFSAEICLPSLLNQGPQLRAQHLASLACCLRDP